MAHPSTSCSNIFRNISRLRHTKKTTSGRKERAELEDEEHTYTERLEEVKEHNKQERKKNGRCKAILQPLPLPGERLNELRARGATRSKLKSWFSNAKTKDKRRNLEPFRAWLSSLTAIHGAPRRIKLPWLVWQHPTHGEALRVRYHHKYKKDADDELGQARDGFEKDDESDEEDEEEEDAPAVNVMNRKYDLARTYYEELDEEQQAELMEQRDKDFKEQRAAYERSLKGRDDMRRRNAESISQRALESLCSQMECKGMLILGEILDGEGEIFISMVNHGVLPKHEGVNFTKWAPVRSKAVMQTFADFLVACKKDEKGVLGIPRDQGPPNVGTATLCAHCASSLVSIPCASSSPAAALVGKSSPMPAPEALLIVDKAAACPAREKTRYAQKKPRETAGKQRQRAKKKSKKSRAKGEEEAEAEESGAGEDGSGSWSNSDRDSDTGEEEEPQLETSAVPVSTPPPSPQLMRTPKTPLREKLAAMPTPQRHRTIHEFNTLSSYEFERENNIARNQALLRNILPAPASVLLGVKAPAAPRPDAPPPPRRTSRRLAGPAGSTAAGQNDHGNTPSLLLGDTPADSGDMPADSGDAPAADQQVSSPALPSTLLMDNVPARTPTPPLGDAAAAPIANSSSSAPAPAVDLAPLAMNSVRLSVPPIAALSVSPSVSHAASPPAAPAVPSAKHMLVRELFGTGVDSPTWTAAVEAWWALEEATGFQIVGKALSPRGRPEAVGWWVQRGRNSTRIPLSLGDVGKEDDREDFYVAVMKWWVEVNPGWRKDEDSAARFEVNGLKQEGNGDLDSLPPGLNGLTSVLACLWWWHRLAGVPAGLPAWKKIAADVTWVLVEKKRALVGKRSASPTSEERPEKRARIV
ncbi:hypothetical protein MSAN_00097500 [Mycena sanguinolenta]|uniref:Uncharacterized protein n=1 Tax=Mycena sanguinolenta TaxID=230812 RepID=A0A8H6ZH72_9AGAR|nr:hypothetical protein MSAN_00097500 [Mycena sanguinolenta]